MELLKILAEDGKLVGLVEKVAKTWNCCRMPFYGNSSE